MLLLCLVPSGWKSGGSVDKKVSLEQAEKVTQGLRLLAVR